MFRPLEASTAFGGTFAKPRKPLLKPSSAAKTVTKLSFPDIG